MTGLRDYQVEPVNDVVRFLTARPGEDFPANGLRAQLIAACGTGKTFMSAHAGIRLARKGAVLVLVPTLDLLGQTIETWRAAGRGGAMYTVCSLADHEPAVGVLCTTSAARLGFWLDRAGPGVPVTVFGTYASLPTVIGAHVGGLGIPAIRPWDALVVDEAHRTSGSGMKAWAAVHDNTQVPALRRLYMTATPRCWNIPEPDGAGTNALPPREPGAESLPRGLAMSMDDPKVFGPVANSTLTLARCQELGILARYQIIALEIADPVLHTMLESEDESAREARLAAVQIALLKAMRDESMNKVISFHNRIADAEVFASTLPRRVATDDDLTAMFPDGVWARWLSGEHTARHRRTVLDDFDSPRPGGTPRPAVLANCRVLGEGVDGRSDAVLMNDPKGSVVDLVQAIGRALRQQPGQGKTASIIVPVIVRKPGTGTVEDAAGGDMVSDPAFAPLLTVLQGLRAHDSDLVEGLAVPQRRSRTQQPDPWLQDEEQAQQQPDGGGTGPALVLRAVLKFAGGKHTAAEVAAAVQLRVLSPEAQSWLRGYSAARRWHQAFGSLAVPTHATEPGPSDYPLGRFIADQRAAYANGTLLPSRQERLEDLGMVWSAHDAAWQANLTAARAWAHANGGHLSAPVTTTWDGTPIGRFLADMRTAAARTTGPGALTDARRKALDEIDPWWCPPWPLAWQRTFRTAQAHVHNGGTLTALPTGHLIAGEDIGTWTRTQQTRWNQLGEEQQELLAQLGLTAPTQPTPAQPTSRSQAQRFTTGLAAATTWAQQHDGTIAAVKRNDTQDLDDGTTVKLGVWIMNTRSRRAKLTPEQLAALDALGMRW
ncbi:Helicase associated domain protein [Streptacidiphilus sp. N1-3]|uniref:Helicase associated domain protein n=1 Tax=Streptacidiphilus alkalitolerans TaxID=3342712 RepID=A0ABV6WZD7_9ACTN